MGGQTPPLPRNKNNMAKVELNPLFDGLSGSFGDLVFRRSSTGKTYISQRPAKSTKEPSEAQKAHRERFGQASTYAKAALADPDMRLHYEKLAAHEGKTAYTLAIADYMNGSPLPSSPKYNDRNLG